MPRDARDSRLVALGCVLLAGGLLLPPRAYADSPTLRVSLVDSARLAAVREAGVMKERRPVQTPPADRTNLRSGSFFKSPAGIATLAIFGAGVGYAFYSSRNDRIRSTGR